MSADLGARNPQDGQASWTADQHPVQAARGPLRADGTAHDEPDLAVVAAEGSESETAKPAAATVHGAAADLNCWLWHRPPLNQVERPGDPAVLKRLDQTIAASIN